MTQVSLQAGDTRVPNHTNSLYIRAGPTGEKHSEQTFVKAKWKASSCETEHFYGWLIVTSSPDQPHQVQIQHVKEKAPGENLPQLQPATH